MRKTNNTYVDGKSSCSLLIGSFWDLMCQAFKAHLGWGWGGTSHEGRAHSGNHVVQKLLGTMYT